MFSEVVDGSRISFRAQAQKVAVLSLGCGDRTGHHQLNPNETLGLNVNPFDY